MMAPETATMITPPATVAEWNETDLVSSLARLQEMHVHLRHLRECVARIVDPTLSQQPSPDDFYTDFSRSATTTANEIKSFTTLINDTQSKDILKKSKELRAAEPETIKVWMVTDHEDWLDVKAEDAKDNTTVEEETNEVHKYTLDTKVEDINAVVESYRVNHPEVKTSLGEKSVVKVSLSAPAHIDFEIEPTTASGTQTIYNVSCGQKSQIHAAIVRTIAARPRLEDLNYLLEMLASYIDVKSSPCIKCRRLLDQNAQFPVVRMRKRTKGPDGLFVTQWLAFHIGCT